MEESITPHEEAVYSNISFMDAVHACPHFLDLLDALPNASPCVFLRRVLESALVEAAPLTSRLPTELLRLLTDVFDEEIAKYRDLRWQPGSVLIGKVHGKGWQLPVR